MARLLGRWEDRTPPWYEARRGRVGGSDIGAICGWGTPGWNGKPIKNRADVMAEKLEPPTPKATKGKARGVYCEPAIAAWLADNEGIEYDPDLSSGTWVADDDDRFMGNPDAVSTDGAYCEFKTTDWRDVEHGWGRAGTDKVPLAYSAQCMWLMGIFGLDHALLAVLSGQPRFEFSRYKIKFDQTVFDYLREEADRFLVELAAEQQKCEAA